MRNRPPQPFPRSWLLRQHLWRLPPSLLRRRRPPQRAGPPAVAACLAQKKGRLARGGEAARDGSWATTSARERGRAAAGHDRVVGRPEISARRAQTRERTSGCAQGLCSLRTAGRALLSPTRSAGGRRRRSLFRVAGPQMRLSFQRPQLPAPHLSARSHRGARQPVCSGGNWSQRSSSSISSYCWCAASAGDGPRTPAEAEAAVAAAAAAVAEVLRRARLPCPPQSASLTEGSSLLADASADASTSARASARASSRGGAKLLGADFTARRATATIRMEGPLRSLVDSRRGTA